MDAEGLNLSGASALCGFDSHPGHLERCSEGTTTCTHGGGAAGASDHAVEGVRVDTPPSGGGEQLGIAERVVVAPAAGTFQPSGSDFAASEGEPIDAGRLLGVVSSLSGEAEVRSPFAGFFMGLLALPGERVHPRQPIAWLRTY